MLALFRSFLTKNAMETGRFVWLYGEYFNPVSKECVQYLTLHHGKYSVPL